MRIARRTLAGALAGLAAAPRARAQAPTLRVAYQYGTSHVPVTYAQATGLFARAGEAAGIGNLAISGQRVVSSAAVNDALVSGAVDLGVTATPALLIAWDRSRQNLRVGAVCGLALTPVTLVTTQPGIRSVADFAPDARIAVSSPVGMVAVVLRMAAERAFGPGQHGRLDSRMVTLSHPDSVAALRSGQIAGYVAVPPFTKLVLADPRVHAVWSSLDIIGGPVTGIAIGAAQRLVDSRPREVAAVIAALDQAVAEIAADPRRAAAIYHATEGQGMTLQDVVTALEDRDQRFDLSPLGTEIFADFMARTGMMRNRIASWRDVFFPAVHDRQGS